MPHGEGKAIFPPVEVVYLAAVIDALKCLTRAKDETCEAFIERVLPNALARRVTMADLEDNMDTRRMPTITAKDTERLGRYRAAYARIKATEGAQ